AAGPQPDPGRVRVGGGERSQEDGVEGAEKRGTPADAERERGDRDSGEPGIASELPQSIADVSSGHIQPRAMATISNAFLGLFQASQLERGSTAGFGRCCTVADFVGGRHVGENLQLVVPLLVGSVSTRDPASQGGHAMY